MFHTFTEPRSSIKRAIVVALLLCGGSALAACSSGPSIEGTYYGTAGDTVLILESGGKCGYTDDYDPEKGLDLEVSKDCSWSLSGSNITLIGVAKKGSLMGIVGDDGAISIPDQAKWRGEIYSKK
ncbi:hypothetical protein I6B53_02295 [Schaalia sp. 19OD2882]|uniref:hypothetical protein n=1 Tax=Schaalia sp. 19OD2882 TaxID=2794089 RepID=UPI001C1F0F00|nr:hypothetical protein [Schaalia sp. 19OD2882]QWW19964.1 hypothetical protein I6B53_02295 [Schaalia sp. 19OD2882]